MNFSSPQTRRNNPKAIRRIANAAPNCRLWRGSNVAVAVWLIGISPSFLTLPVPVSLHRGVNAQFDNRAAWNLGVELNIPCERALNRHQLGPVDDPDGRRAARLDDAMPYYHSRTVLPHHVQGRTTTFIKEP